jgi:hypothetical protein
MPPEPSSAAYASTSSVAHAGDGGGVAAVATAPGPSFASQVPTGGVQTHPSLDSEAMVDAALTNMLHDVEEDLPSLPPLSEITGLTTSPTHAHPHLHSQAVAHPALDIFDTF